MNTPYSILHTPYILSNRAHVFHHAHDAVPTSILRRMQSSPQVSNLEI